MRLPKGQEHGIGKYCQERRSRWTWKDNPYGRRCEACGKIIQWQYRSGVLWESPRFYCARDKCQQVRSHRTTYQNEYGVNRPAYGN